MKIRADFVTNSSSSCYVTVLLETKDGKRYGGAFDGDDLGFYDGGFSTNQRFTLKAALEAADGKALIKALDEAYGGLFSKYKERDCLFAEYESGASKANDFRRKGIQAIIGAQNEVEALSLDDIKSIKLIEETGGDFGNAKGELELDFVNKTEHVKTEGTLDMDFIGNGGLERKRHEEIRNLATGEVNVLQNESFEVEYDEEEDEEY